MEKLRMIKLSTRWGPLPQGLVFVWNETTQMFNSVGVLESNKWSSFALVSLSVELVNEFTGCGYLEEVEYEEGTGINDRRTGQS